MATVGNFGHKWRINLRPASFRGVSFKVELGAQASGRRTVPFEFPKQDQGFCEDMGRRLRQFHFAGYIIQGPPGSSSGAGDYQAARDNLIAALESDAGGGQLIHPTLGVNVVMVDHYSVSEHREKGGFAEFDMAFIEAGVQVAAPRDTRAAVTAAAQAALNGLPLSSTMAAAFLAPAVLSV